MGLYNFQPRFKRHIKSRRKKHTIRAPRKYPDKPGDVLHLYTGLRTKSAKLIERVICTRVEPISIYPHTTYVNDCILDDCEMEALAYADGFDSVAEMLEFWKGRLPFHGAITYWREMTRSETLAFGRRKSKKGRKDALETQTDAPPSQTKSFS